MYASCCDMSGHRSFARNVISNWVVLAGGVVYALVITPVMVRALDKESYGVWVALTGLLTYTELLYLGLGSAMIKFVAQFRATEDQPSINRLASTVLTIYTLLGLVCLVVFASVSGVIPDAFAEPLGSETRSAAIATCVLLGVQMVFVFIGSAFSGLICGYDRYDLVNLIGIGSIAVRFVATPLLVRRGHDPLLTLGVLSASVSALQAAAMAAMAFRTVPNLVIRPRRPRPEDLRMLYSFGIQSFFIILAVKLITYTDTTVIGITLGATSVALYNFPLQLVEYARMFVGGFASVFLPRLTVSLGRGERDSIGVTYLNSVRIACFLSGWLLALIVGLGTAFINKWVGTDFGTPVQWVLVYLAVATFGQVLSSQVPLPFYQALNLVSFPAVVLVCEALANLGLSIWLAPKLGITGVALATAIPAVCLSMIVLPRFLTRHLQISLPAFLRAVAPGLAIASSAFVTVRLLGSVVGQDSYASLIIRAGASVPLALAVIQLTFPLNHRKLIWELVGLKRMANSNSISTP